MNYLRKFIAGTAAGVAISAAVSMNRNGVARLLRLNQRPKILEEMRLHHEENLSEIELTAVVNAGAIMKDIQNTLAASMRKKGLSEDEIEDALAAIHADICEALRLHRQAWATRAYGMRVFPLNKRLADEQWRISARLMSLENDIADWLRDQGVSISDLAGRLERRD